MWWYHLVHPLKPSSGHGKEVYARVGVVSRQFGASKHQHCFVRDLLHQHLLMGGVVEVLGGLLMCLWHCTSASVMAACSVIGLPQATVERKTMRLSYT
jgi:hypothetical protein